MDDPRWTRMWDLFHGAAELAASARPPWLSQQCADDPGLVQEVLRLLESHEQATDFLEPAAAARAAAPPTGPEPLPAQIGPYRLLERAGEGGFAEVWRAEQTAPVRRTVALKVLKPGMDSRAVLARFEQEQQTLARLQHPGIATVFDAGVAPGGRPFVAMEFVAGLPITRFCDQQRLDLRARLLLFQQVCEAVQHAHQRGVIHRDLKPSNILVAAGDGASQVKVIDFGIAKAIEPLAEGTLLTGAGQLVGTPEYMSPEQVAGEDLDTRSDVYALGVVLYELLAGVRPFQTARARVGAAVLDELRHRDPPRPSTQTGSTGADAAAIAAQRRLAGPSALAQRLRGELDWITLMALERDRDRRYGSPAELAADLGRHLRHEPVLAGPPGAGYRLRKLVRRHRAATAAALVVAVVLAAFVVHLGVTARTERRLREAADLGQRAAEDNLRIANGVNEFFAREVLAAADPRRTGDADLTVRQALDAAAEKVGAKFANEPLLEAAVRQTIGDTYRSLGEFAAALPQSERAAELFTAAAGEDDPRTQSAANVLAILYGRLGRSADAERIHRQLFASRQRTLGPDHEDTLTSMVNLGVACAAAGRGDEAEQLLRAAVPALERTLGRDHENTLTATFHLAATLARGQRHAEAEPLLRRVLAGYEQAFGEDHPHTMAAVSHLATLLDDLGRAEEAAPLVERNLAASIRRLGEDHVETATARLNLGLSYMRQRRFAEAEPLMLQAVQRIRAVFGDAHRSTLGAENNLGTLYDHWGRQADAEPHLALAADGGRSLLPETDWARGLYLLNHGRCLHRIGRSAEGLARLREAFAILLATLGGAHPRARESLVELAIVEEALGHVEEAAALRARLQPREAGGR